MTWISNRRYCRVNESAGRREDYALALAFDGNPIRNLGDPSFGSWYALALPYSYTICFSTGNRRRTVTMRPILVAMQASATHCSRPAKPTVFFNSPAR